MFLKPIQRPAQHVFAMRQLFDAVTFVGIDDHLGFDTDFLQRAIKHLSHRDRAAAIVERMQDERGRAHPALMAGRRGLQRP